MAQTRLETRLTARDDTARAFRSLTTSLAVADRAFTNLTKVAAGLGVVFGGLFIRDLVEVNKKFQSLEASLVTFTGSTRNAKGAFGILQEFAKTTPFSLEEVVGSFNVLISQGIKPTEEQLRNFADIAGGTSKSIIDFSKAVTDAAVGEFQTLKSFGIKTKKEGEKITFSIGDLTKTINNDSQSILAALAEIGKTKFAGGAARQAETLGGSFTNLRDNVDKFMFDIGEAGLSKEIGRVVRSLSSMIDGNQDLARSISDTAVKAIQSFVGALRFLNDNLDVIYRTLQVAFGLFIIKKIIMMGQKLLLLRGVITGVAIAVALLTKRMVFVPTLLAAVATAVLGATGNLEDFRKKIEETFDWVDKKIGLTETYSDVLQKLGFDTGVTSQQLADMGGVNAGLTPLITKNIGTLEDYTGNIKSAGKAAEETFGAGALRGVKEYFDSVSNSANNAAEFTKGAFSSLQNALSEFFQTGKLDFGGFVDAIKRGLADLAAKSVVSTGISFLGKVFPTLKFADGGFVPGAGGPREDNILARLSSGEYVMQASSVNKFGRGFFDQLNAGQMPGGGISLSENLAESITPGFGFGGFFKSVAKTVTKVVDVAKSAAKGVADAVKGVVGFVSGSVQNMINNIMKGDLLTIASLASSFILPGLGTALAGSLGPAAAGGFSGILGNVGTAISTSFANGILGSGSLSVIAKSVAVEFAKGTVINALSKKISDKIVGSTDSMTDSLSAYDSTRAAAFATLYNKAAPYLARATGGPVSRGDNVLVGERGPEMFIPNRNGTISPIKSQGSDLIRAVVDMKDEIISLRRDMARMMSGQALVGARV